MATETIDTHADAFQIGLTADPIDVAGILGRMTDGRAGGIDLFLGTTRDEQSTDGRRLIALDYDAYPEMAIRKMHDLVARAAERWPIVRAAIVHRTGRVPVGQASVLIAVATPHRADSFEACRWLIDTLKQEVPIWKQEIWADGSASWVHPT